MRRQMHLVALATLLFLVSLLAPVVLAKSSTGNRALVLLDKLNDQPLYSKFWKSLEARSYSLSFKLATDADLAIAVHDERLYDHIIIFSPKVKTFGGSVTLQTLVGFVKDGGNLLLAASPTISETIRDLAREFDVEFDDRDTAVIDHFSYNVKSDKLDHTIIVTDSFSSRASAIFSPSAAAPPIIFHGIAHRAGSVPLLTRVLSAPRTAYSAETATGASIEEVFVAGDEVTLVSAFQASNNARAVFAGSLDLFSDKFVDAAVQKYGEGEKAYGKSGNEAFITELTKWVFQEKGVIKVVSARHHKALEKEQMSWYRIKDNIIYTLELAEFKDDHWQPFGATDLQLEITMLDPYIRTYLNRSAISQTSSYARYVANVQLPDVYGVFTFKINYKRPGLSYLEAKHEVSIRPFRHNEYPRFLSAAYPYYAGSTSMVVGFLVFSAVWLGTWGVRKADAKKV